MTSSGSRLHLVAFPHTRLDDEFVACAHTQKVRRMRQMDLGRPLIVYGTEGTDVVLLDEDERRHVFGDHGGRSRAWPADELWVDFNVRAVESIAANAEPGDLLLLPGGASQKLVADVAEPLGLTVCEPGVGYAAEACFADRCAFESYAWMHHVYARNGWQPRPADAVIPLSYDPADFPHLNSGDGDYLLFLGRVMADKGPDIAAAIAKAAGMPLLIAGHGVQSAKDGVMVVGDDVVVRGSHVTYVGPVDAAARAELLAGARALLMPTRYTEPFGSVAIEAMAAGTPVIAPDWGAFVETVQPAAGFRFRTVEQAAAAVAGCTALDPKKTRAYARRRYSTKAVAPMFRAWFDRLDTVE